MLRALCEIILMVYLAAYILSMMMPMYNHYIVKNIWSIRAT